MTAASRKHQSLRLFHEYHLPSQWTISIMRKPDGRSARRCHLCQLREETHNHRYRYTVLFTTGRAPLFLGSTHEQRQFLKVEGRMEWHLPRMARYIVTGTSA